MGKIFLNAIPEKFGVTAEMHSEIVGIVAVSVCRMIYDAGVMFVEYKFTYF